MNVPAAAAILLVTISTQVQTDTFPRCAKVRIDDASVGTIIGISGDRITRVRTGVFVNGSPVGDVCDAVISLPFPLPKDVPSVEVTVPPGQYFVASETRTGTPRPTPTARATVRREFGLFAADRVALPGR
jgi:hypothetical protein